MFYFSWVFFQAFLSMYLVRNHDKYVAFWGKTIRFWQHSNEVTNLLGMEVLEIA